MTLIDALWHGLHFVLPAGGMAAVLALALAWPFGRRAAQPAWRWLRVWGVFTALGVAVLVVGLWWWGRDGRMATYATLVVVMGTTAALWRAR